MTAVAELVMKPLEQPLRTREREFVDPRSIAFATTTLYKEWKPLRKGQTRDFSDVDGLRGDLALKTLTEAYREGFQIVVVDDGSTDAFKQAVSEKIKKPPIEEKPSREDKPTLSPARRRAFGEAAKLRGVKVIAWVEPEKVSMAMENNLQKAALPIIQGTADIVIPQRDLFAYLTYPDSQVEQEQELNTKFNTLLKENGLLPETADELDISFGPRLFRYDPDNPEVLELFMHQWERDDTLPANRNPDLDPELWAGATFLPIIAKLYQDKLNLRHPRVVGVPIDFIHPYEQTESEQASEEFAAKHGRKKKEILDASGALVQIFSYDTFQEKPLYRERK